MAAAPAAPTTVLVVEDNATLGKMLRRALERPDRRVLLAGDAESALALFIHHDETINLVIADVRLPGMSGNQLAAELRRRDPNVAILLTSGDFDGPPGQFPELEKPYTLVELERCIAETLWDAKWARQSALHRQQTA